MIFLYAFLLGGFISLIGQLMIDKLKMTPIHVTGYFVILGAILDFFGIYDFLIETCGAGALVPITSFGHSLLHGALEKAKEIGIIGLGMGMFDLTASGITAAILFAFLAGLVFKPKG